MGICASLSPFLANAITDLFSTGSVAELSDGTLKIQSAPSRYILWVLAFVVVLPISWWCWRRRVGGHIAPSIFFASFLIPLIVVPGIAMESIKVTPAGLTLSTGFWFSPTFDHIPFQNLESITERSEGVGQRVFERNHTFWYFRYRTGQQRRLNLSDLFDAHRHSVVEYLRHHGIYVRNA